ncbi:myotubularin-related protein 3 isoform X2 [Scaptodrosophila lebanonensis]|uniref:Myotubularin-related protein 3 isoform X2 n=1 Tax=Drosophila lebanonensis TaxID=7225 RepID=A0A6J2TWW1_DROLE|nr:myotubularin-related protein 3 isoform X2 [Scaptodrosophila lebanonensis]
MSDGSPPPSICFIRAAESYPKSQMEKEDSQLFVPFQELAGESIKYLGRTDDGVLALSNYRIYLSKKSTASETYVPLGLIESVQMRDLFHMMVNCKDASTVRCSFQSAEQCSEWQRRIQLSIGVPETLETLFAFPFYSWTCDIRGNKERAPSTNGIGTKPPTASEGMALLAYAPSDQLQRAVQYNSDFKNEVARLGFDLKGSWRISTANSDFKLCPSYPQKLLVPCCITDDMLHNIANFRGSRRLPAVVWRHQKSGAVLARCSQPEVGWLGWRNSKDERLLKALAEACAFDRGENARRSAQNAKDPSVQTNSSGKSSPSLENSSHEELALDEIRKILIVDARSYTSAVTNRARGGGCECIEYYPCAEIEFMNLGNIHAIRKSFHAVRQLCASSPDDPSWLSQLEKTMWMQHLSGLLGASMTVVHAIESKGRPVLVHCSDGWDRTPQIVATAQLCLDPYYRTVEGFRVLVEREWLSFGHKFADRTGNGPNSDELNERCPVFLQWLDLVHQIHRQFECSFEFSTGYLIKLAQHSMSCLFGTFLCNSLRERIENSVFDRTFSVWPFLSESMYRNPLYKHENEKVLWPAHNVRSLHFWSEVYLGSLGNKNGTDLPPLNNERQNDHTVSMTKTRSSGDLTSSELGQSTLSRRSSDPNLTVELNVTDYLNLNSSSMFDIRSDGNECDTQVVANSHNSSEDSTMDTCKNDFSEQPEFLVSKDSIHIASKSDADKNSVANIKHEISEAAETSLELELPARTDSDSSQYLNLKMDNKTNNDFKDNDALCDSRNDQTPEKFNSQNLVWNGPIDTSTDTLIALDSSQNHNERKPPVAEIKNGIHLDRTSGISSESICPHTNKISLSYSNLPKVHVKPNTLRYLQLANKGCSDQWDIFPHHLDLHVPRDKNGTTISCKEDHLSKELNGTLPLAAEINNIDAGAGICLSPEHHHRMDFQTNAFSTFEIATAANQMQRNNTLSSNSSRDNNAHSKCADNGSAPHSSVLNSLPPTPQGTQDRTQLIISCPDGLAHALSEQNVRLHQLVQEHKLREDILLREIHSMRLALLHKTCPCCNSVISTNVEHIMWRNFLC